MKAPKATEQVVVYGQPVSVSGLTKPVMVEALNDAAAAIKRQKAQVTRLVREVDEREERLAEVTAKATELAHEVTYLRGGQDRSNELVSFYGSLAAYTQATGDKPTIAEMTDLVSRWKVVIQRFADVDYDFVAKPLKFRGTTLNITLAQGEGSRRLSYIGSNRQPERWALYLGILVMNRTRWNTLRVKEQGENGREFVAYISCTLRKGSEPVITTQDSREFVLALRNRK